MLSSYFLSKCLLFVKTHIKFYKLRLTAEDSIFLRQNGHFLILLDEEF
jgi:hypothetical protein